MGCLQSRKESKRVAFTPKTHPDPRASPKQPVSSPEDWKEQGNSHFNAKNYVQAVQAYSQAIVRLRQMLNPHVSIFYSNRARSLLYLREFQSAAVDAAKALQLDELNVKAYLLCAQAKGYIAAQGEDALVTEALEHCLVALGKCREKGWKDGIEKSKLLRTKLQVLQANSLQQRQQSQLRLLLRYYEAQSPALHSAITALLPAAPVSALPDYFTCLISLVRGS